MAKFKDDKIEVIESDVEKIRKRPSMYMASLSEAGCLHICKEIIDNNRDECFKKDSPGNTIWIDITSKYITAKDNGRGIPTNSVKPKKPYLSILALFLWALAIILLTIPFIL